MLPPALDRLTVAGDPDGLQNGVPQLVHGLLLGAVRKHLSGPAWHRHGADGPGDGVGHGGLAVLRDLGGPGLPHADKPLGVHVGHQLRVAGVDVEEARALPGQAHQQVRLPLGVLVKGLVGGPQGALVTDDLVAPAHGHLPAAGVVGGLHAHAGKPGAVHRTVDEQLLARLDVDAHLYQQTGVLRESLVAVIHFVILLKCMLHILLAIRRSGLFTFSSTAPGTAAAAGA